MFLFAVYEMRPQSFFFVQKSYHIINQLTVAKLECTPRKQLLFPRMSPSYSYEQNKRLVQNH